MSVKNRLGVLGLCLAILAPLTACQTVSAQTVGVGVIIGSRLVTEPSGLRDDNNGGAGGTLTMGINTGGVDNFALLGLDPVGLSVLGGLDLGGNARVIVPVRTNFTNGNHGTTADKFHLYELPSANTGWIEGEAGIGGADRPADNGSVSFLNFSQYNDDPGPPSGTTIPWTDENGQPVANFLDALGSPIASVPGWNQGSAPNFLEFPIPLSTLEDWTVNGVAGLGIVIEDDGDSRSRYVIFQDGAGVLVDLATAVPEPSTLLIAFVGLFCCGASRRQNNS